MRGEHCHSIFGYNGVSALSFLQHNYFIQLFKSQTLFALLCADVQPLFTVHEPLVCIISELTASFHLSLITMRLKDLLLVFSVVASVAQTDAYGTVPGKNPMTYCSDGPSPESYSFLPSSVDFT